MKQLFTLLFLSAAMWNPSFSQTLFVNFSSDDGQVSSNVTTDIDVSVSNFSDIAGSQFPISWDSDVFEFVSVSNFSTDIGLHTGNFSNVEDGVLRFAWTSASAAGVDLDDDHVIFTITLKAIADECAHSALRIQSLPSMAIEVFNSNYETYEVCTNSFVGQIAGAGCPTDNSTLVCLDQLNVSLDATNSAQLYPSYFLDGGPYNLTDLTVTPSKVNCSNLGTQTYTVTDNETGNTCWGQLSVVEGVADCSGTANNSIACNDQVSISLDQNGEAYLVADMFLEGGPYNYNEFDVDPSYVDCDDLGVLTYTVRNTVSGNSCWGTVMVEDKINACDNGNGTGNSTLACRENISVSINPWGETSITPGMVLEGGPYDYSTLSVTPDRVGCDDISVMQYTVTDQATGNSCWGNLNVVDQTPPVVILRENVVVSLTSSPSNPNGYVAKVYAESVDNGSFDNCTDITFDPEYVEYDCSDIGQQQLIIRATDAYGNYNETWTTITVELKTFTADSISCPDDIVVDCSTDLEDLSILGAATIDSGCAVPYSDFYGYDENGDGDMDDTYVLAGEEYMEDYNVACNYGSLQRKWLLNGSDLECNQIIYVKPDSPALTADDIVFPEDVVLSCSQDYVKEPTWVERSCSLIGWSVDIDSFAFEDDACYKVLRRYAVIDWCAYDPNDDNTPGFFTHTQVVKFTDIESPIITTQDTEVNSCNSSSITLSASGIDSCTTGNLHWRAEIDFNNDFTVDDVQESTLASGQAFLVQTNLNNSDPDGNHRVVWTLTDPCGNIGQQTSYFTIGEESEEDTVEPTPYCVNLSTALLSNGSVDIYASDFNVGSFDNCTTEENLRFTFSDTNPANDSDYNNFQKTSVRTFTTDDLNGRTEQSINLNMYVWDESNNSDFCTVTLILKEGNNGNGNGQGDEVSLYLSNKRADAGDLVCVSMTTDNFRDVSSLQGTVEFDDRIIRYNSTKNYQLPGLNASSFGTLLDDKLTFLWFDQTGQNPQSLPNGSKLFDICFDVVGQSGDRSDVSFSNSPTAIEIANFNETFDVKLFDGSVIVGEGADCTNDDTAPVPVCIALSTALLDNGQVELYAIDFDAGSYDNCSDVDFTFTNVPPSNDPDFNAGARSSSKIFTLADTDINNEVNVTLYVWDSNENFNTCWVKLRLEGGTNCDFSEDDITWPSAIIEVNLPANSSSELSELIRPENLVQNAGLSRSSVYPTFAEEGCTNIVSSYNDVVLEVDSDSGYYKVVRSWIVLDWLTGDSFEFTQVIKNYISDEYICDTLPRSAPLGDCASGHTDTDDVEWPNDITIADHRISPAELVSVSGVLAEDASPIFYNEPEKYSATYIDLVITLSQDLLEIGRVWTATREDVGGTSWEYQQKITVDLSDFGNLVTISTMERRPVPDVTVDGVVTTDVKGSAYTEEDIDPFKDDVSRNGLNIKDVVLMRAQLLGIELLDENEMIAADINEDGSVSNQDLSDIKKVILGLNNSLSKEWTFIEEYNEVIAEPKANYIAVKPGDIDDTAELGDSIDIEATENLIIEDQLINAGELYSVPLYFEREIVSFGAELHLTFDAEALTIKGVSSTNAFGDISWSIKNDNEIVILNYNSDAQAENITPDIPILTLEFEAKRNGLLIPLLGLSDNDKSWILDEAYNLLRVKGITEGEISSSIEDIVDLGFGIYPNPTNQYMNIKTNEDFTTGWRTQVFDMAGRLVLADNTSQTVIDVSGLTDGLYMYKISVDNQVQIGKLMVKKDR